MAPIRPRPPGARGSQPDASHGKAEPSPATGHKLPEVPMPDHAPEHPEGYKKEESEGGAGKILGKIFLDMARQQLCNFADNLAAVYALDPGTIGDLLRETAGEFSQNDG